MSSRWIVAGIVVVIGIALVILYLNGMLGNAAIA